MSNHNKSPILDSLGTASEQPGIGEEAGKLLKPSRRRLLQSLLSAGGVAVGGLAAPWLVHARPVQPPGSAQRPNSAAEFWTAPRWVWLTRPATGEQIRQVYWRDGQLIQSGYEAISWFMRDVRFQRMLNAKDHRIAKALDVGRIKPEHLTPWMLMDPVILDILYAYCAWLQGFGINQPVVLTSAFRHMLTNDLTEGAVRDSWHVKGGAADIVIPSVPTANAAAFGKWLAGGGVGLYSSKRFVHLDRGRVRSWAS